jgi:predicted lipoprotein with Yx(FWY)xxD motif
MRSIGPISCLALGVLAIGCGNSSNKAPDAAVTVDAPNAGEASVSLAAAGFLVDSSGKTLYIFANDIAGTASNCGGTAGGCVANWPVFYAGASPTFGAGLTATDFATITPSAGVPQTTWKGRPLYYHAADTSAAPTAGENVGPGRWFVARAYNLYFGANTAVTPLEGAGVAGTAKDPYFTNGAGRTLYVHKGDTRGTATTPPVGVAAAVLASWPAWQPAAAGATPVLPSTIAAADLTTYTNANIAGASQLQFVYKGWPLYFFVNDPNPGDVNGATGATGATWKAVNVGWDGSAIQ